MCIRDRRLRVDKGERGVFVSPPLTGDAGGEPLALRAEREPGELGEALALREVIQRRAELEQWVLRSTDGELLRLFGLREVAAMCIRDRRAGRISTPASYAGKNLAGEVWQRLPGRQAGVIGAPARAADQSIRGQPPYSDAHDNDKNGASR